MPRIFHFSDTHLGHQQYSRTDDHGLNQREQDLYAAFDHVIDTAVEERPDLVIHAGDLFDGVRPGNRPLAHALEGFLHLSQAGIPTVVIAGNHEHPKMRETGSPFRILSHLPGVHVVYKAQREDIPIDTASITVHAVPQCVDNQALADQAGGIDTSTPGHHVLVLHGAVHSLKAFSHAEFNELSLDPRWFQGHDYVALGHYHATQQVADNAWYCGAPERVSMAEAGQEKGFLDIVVEDGPPQVRFRAVPGRPYRDAPVLRADAMDATQIEAAVRAEIDRMPAGGVGRIRVEDVAADLRGVLDVRALRQGHGCCHLEVQVAFTDASHRVRGGERLGGVEEEFAAYSAHHPIDGLERERLLAMARDVLQEAGP